MPFKPQSKPKKHDRPEPEPATNRPNHHRQPRLSAEQPSPDPRHVTPAVATAVHPHLPPVPPAAATARAGSEPEFARGTTHESDLVSGQSQPTEDVYESPLVQSMASRRKTATA